MTAKKKTHRLSQLSDLDFEVSREHVTPKQAREYLDTKNFKRNRPIRRARVREYAAKMEAGTFRSGKNLVFVLVPNGNDESELILADGQHSLSAVVESGLPMYFTTTTYYLNKPEELEEVYATIDVGTARNLGDSVRAFGLPEELNLPQQHARRLAAAANLVLHGYNRPSKIRGAEYQKNIEFALDYAQEGIAFFGCIKGAPVHIQNTLSAQPILAAGLITLRGEPEKATDFWFRVASNSGEGGHESPCNKLLLEILSRASQDAAAGGGLKSPRSYGCLIASAWNHFLKGNSIKNLRPLETPRFNRCKWEAAK